MMWLVDTSVWIDFLKGVQNPPVQRLCQLLAHDEPIAITSVIYQEILQGADSEKSFRSFQSYFGSQTFVYSHHPVKSYTQAARIYFTCRRKGITIHSTIDCLIAQVALEHDLYLLHNDRDYMMMARVITDLKLAETFWQGSRV